MTAIDALLDDAATLKALVISMQARAFAAEANAAAANLELVSAQADAAAVKAELTTARVVVESLKLEIARLKREAHGQKSERLSRLIDQMELELEEFEADAREDEIAAERAAAKANRPPREGRKHPVKKPFPPHLLRERIVVQPPTSCACCGGNNLHKLGEDVTETLDAIPRQFKVVQTVREKFSCRDCEKISQPPAPFHAIARGHVGASLLAMILYDKYALHQPLNRQSAEFARAGIDLCVSTLADHVGSAASALAPLHNLIEAHVFAAARVHGDDTTVPLLARKKTITARLWTYVRDDRPFGGSDPPAAVFYFSPNRLGEHPERHLEDWRGVLQADAYGGYQALYAPDRQPGPIIEAACWAHGRRKFFVLADLAAKMRDARVTIAPIALEALRRIDEIFDIERSINGLPQNVRRDVRQAQSKPLVDKLHAWMKEERARLSAKAPVAKAFNYMLKRWDAFARFLDDGRICITNNAAERALRTVALGRKSWLFAGSPRGGERAAMIYGLIATCKLNDIDPQAWLADALARIADHPAATLHELLPWNWRPAMPEQAAA
ncbi:MAG: IS66 family transposase [Hyphomicrobium sp.]